MRSVFSTYHPVINFGFFCVVIGTGIFMRHPVFLTAAVIAALTYSVMLGGKGTLRFVICFIIPMILIFTVVNPLVNSRGETVLFYTKYSQVTMEAVIYGLLAGFMLEAVLL